MGGEGRNESSVVHGFVEEPATATDTPQGREMDEISAFASNGSAHVMHRWRRRGRAIFFSEPDGGCSNRTSRTMNCRFELAPKNAINSRNRNGVLYPSRFRSRRDVTLAIAG